MAKLERKKAFQPKRPAADNERRKSDSPSPEKNQPISPKKATVSKTEQRMVRISDIKEPKVHDRIGYDEAAIDELAENMKAVGQAQPIVIRELEDGTLERIIGFRRVLAAKKLGWKEIRADVYYGLGDRDASLMQLSENIMREDTNIYDQTVKINEYLSLALDMNEGELLSKLHRFKNFNAGNILSLTDQEVTLREQINALLKQTLSIDILSLINRLRVLSLDKRLIEEVKKNRIQYSHAVAIEQGAKKGLDIGELIDYAIKYKPTLAALRAHIKSLLTAQGQAESGAIDHVIETGKLLTKRRLKKLPPQTVEQIEKLANEINQLIENNEKRRNK